uniref:Uncharacterized protein n=1 Tax=Glossina austeni TaxID=7395 RepID=A0A1A9UIG5_GLOAU
MYTISLEEKRKYDEDKDKQPTIRITCSKVFVIVFSAVAAVSSVTLAKYLKSDISEHLSEVPKTIVNARDATVAEHKIRNNFSVQRKRDVKHLNITYLPPQTADFLPSPSNDAKEIRPPFDDMTKQFEKLSHSDLTTEVPAASEQKTEILLKSEENFFADILQDTAILADDGYHYKKPSETKQKFSVEKDTIAEVAHLPAASEVNGDIRETEKDSNVMDNHSISSRL